MFYIHWAICFPGFVEDGVGRPGAGAPISKISGIVGQTGPFKARRALGTPGLDFCGASFRGRRAARWMGFILETAVCGSVPIATVINGWLLDPQSGRRTPELILAEGWV